MVRNLAVSGLVATLMSVFVLAFQAVNPAPEQLPAMPNGTVQNGNTQGQSPNPADSTAMTGQQNPSGQMAGATTQNPNSGTTQPGPTMAQAQQPGMQSQPMPMMGMCGRMMQMMMGGQMNQSGGTMQQKTPPQNQPRATPSTQPKTNVARR